MALAKRTAPALSEAVIISESPLELAQWLRVSWFLPSDFHQKRLVETESSLISIGENEVYRFRKFQAPHRPERRELWRLLCEEIHDHHLTAPGLYRGLRPLRWIEDEPRWLTDAPLHDPDPHLPPPNADDGAVVMERLADTQMLLSLLERGTEFPEHYLRTLVRGILRFHRRQRESAAIRFVQESDDYLARKRHYWRGLLALAQEHLGCLTPAIRAAAEELIAFCVRFLSESERVLLQRGEAGCVVNCHGDLVARHVCFRESDKNEVLLFGRPHRSAQTRHDDCISDIAELSLDLQGEGLSREAVFLEEEYRSRTIEPLPDALLSFYVAGSALRRAVKCIIRSSDRHPSREKLRSAELLLAAAYRQNLGLRGPVLIGLAGRESGEKEQLAEELAIITGATRKVSSDEELNRAEARLGEESIVLSAPFYSRNTRLQFAGAARRRRAHYALVRCELSWASRVAQREKSSVCPSETSAELLSGRLECSPTWDRQIFGEEINYLYIEPVIPSAHLALQVLREIANRRPT